jgi:hypothetical protein
VKGDKGALVSINAIGTLQADVRRYFRHSIFRRGRTLQDHRQGARKAQNPNPHVSHSVDRITSERSHPGAPRFSKPATMVMVESRIECGDKIESERRSYISSRMLSATAFV